MGGLKAFESFPHLLLLDEIPEKGFHITIFGL
jgi:hypothetical protein